MKKKEAVLVVFLVAFIIANLANIVFILSVSPGGKMNARASYGQLSLYIVSPTTPTPTPIVTPAGGGGGGGISHAYDFSFEPDLIDVSVKQGETFKTSIKVKNTEKISQTFKVTSNLEDFIILSDYSFVLAGGEERTVYLTFYSLNTTDVGTYPGKVFIETSSKKKYIPIIFNIKSKKVLFDVSLNIPAKYKELLLGEDLLLQLTIFNLGDFEKVDVSIEHQIKDFDGNLILKKDEVVAVGTQASFSRTIILPRNMSLGEYVAISYVRYNDSISSSSDLFRIVEKEKTRINIYSVILALIGIICILLVIILFIILYRKISGMEEKKSKGEGYYKSLWGG